LLPPFKSFDPAVLGPTSHPPLRARLSRAGLQPTPPARPLSATATANGPVTTTQILYMRPERGRLPAHGYQLESALAAASASPTDLLAGATQSYPSHSRVHTHRIDFNCRRFTSSSFILTVRTTALAIKARPSLHAIRSAAWPRERDRTVERGKMMGRWYGPKGHLAMRTVKAPACPEFRLACWAAPLVIILSASHWGESFASAAILSGAFRCRRCPAVHLLNLARPGERRPCMSGSASPGHIGDQASVSMQPKPGGAGFGRQPPNHYVAIRAAMPIPPVPCAKSPLVVFCASSFHNSRIRDTSAAPREWRR